MSFSPTPPPARSSYRHGDLRRALLDAGIELARGGGPDAVVLREATRRAGVVPNAAYRHFASRLDLLREVRAAALAAVALSMETELAAVPAGGPPAEVARAGLRAIGAGYMRFAQQETGLFRTAFFAEPEVLGALTAGPAAGGPSGLNPFELLGAALDRMVDAGVLAGERRPGAEFIAWAAVHGLAMLMIDGPLRGMPGVQIEALGQRLLDMVEKGL
ncbi:TetR/AcrR family transcriptional regulator [Variovorax fucosicus]|uniref:TetR/AcrR family transcriptional regulator n=1 Tax=Variovorax fucosicus TaxID=3053517 RepID=UPI0025757159|nr:TetR/AcrR family transcriptional regulator [Variovorax sp. J22G47]MDM0058295.1 TetR/AcrR family transcriptional regulator [Variovorax sp. J22G47]